MNKQEKPFANAVIAEQSDYVWSPEWSHLLFLNIPVDISSQAISTISFHKDYVKVIPLTIDATSLSFASFLPDKQNSSLNSTVIHQEKLNETRNRPQQDIQTTSLFIDEDLVQTTVTTTQQSISPIHPILTTLRKSTLPQCNLTIDR